jgi:hypothetical protein
MLLPVSAAFITGGSICSPSHSLSSAHKLPYASAFSSAKGVFATNSRKSIGLLKMSFITHYEEIIVPTGRTVSLVDITNTIRGIVTKCECKEGVVTVLSKHSTVSVTINEMEGRLVDDTRQFLLKLAPPYAPYLHNDLDFRYINRNSFLAGPQ